MNRYALLILPAANRVYGRSSPQLAVAELAAVGAAMHRSPERPELATFGGPQYVTFEMDELDDHDRFVLSNLSCAYALFEVTGGDGALRPLPMEPLACFDSDLITIQRYPGKTNEQFTHLLVNVAVAASAAARAHAGERRPVRLLDPVAGRGTTLNRGLMYGFDVAGIDVDGRDYDAYRSFLTTYLKNNRRPFDRAESSIRKGPLAGSKRLTVRIGGTQRVEVVRGDTRAAAGHFAARSFDVLAGDLPYGVQHGSSAGAGWARSPGELVGDALPEWRRVLRAGAGVALSFNTRTLGRPDLCAALEASGFELRDPGPSFDHAVDRSITRDVVVATAGPAG